MRGESALQELSGNFVTNQVKIVCSVVPRRIRLPTGNIAGAQWSPRVSQIEGNQYEPGGDSLEQETTHSEQLCSRLWLILPPYFAQNPMSIYCRLKSVVKINITLLEQIVDS